MTSNTTAQLVAECEPLIEQVIRKTGLDHRIPGGDREDAKQFLRYIVVVYEDEIRKADVPLRRLMLHRRALDALRKWQAERHSQDVPSMRPGARPGFYDELLEQTPEPQPTPEQLVAAKEILDKVRLGVPEMDPDKQQALIDFLDGLTSRETADKLGVSDSRARQLRGEACADIRKKL